ncbi:MAG: AAA family ATPase [Phenylobacterium sp.]|uniref:AAA family ATPase n=1 Tax=Phenylobacterium sp. TaxID=1871053 RepID=UPI00271E9A7F|nr:AAA family ATPase [Phenylobacterium sp.]MDO9431016.1 AAA family ATPase [Phenylobacterium sp.]
MDNTFVYLMGPPGVGKYTVGKLLAERMPARLIDNHYWNNPIFEIVEPDGKTPLPAEVWDRTHAVRTAVLETIATLAPPKRNFIFTHAVSNENHPMDRLIAGQILSTADRRGANTLLVRLSCASAELATRIEEPGRAIRLKARDGSQAERYATLTKLDAHHPWTIDLDTTGSEPDDTARRILQALADPPQG